MSYTLLRRILRRFVGLVWRVRVSGLENVPSTGAVIIASNHLSFIDSVLLPIVVPRQLRFLAKSTYFEGSGFTGRMQRMFFTAVGAVPVQRDSQRDAMGSLKIAIGILNDGGAFGIYPEGTRSRDGRLYDGRPGVGWLALATGAPVVPVAVIGTDKVLPVGSNRPRLHRVEVRFGPAVDPKRWREAGAGGAKARNEITADVMDRIADLSPQVRAHMLNDRSADEEAES